MSLSVLVLFVVDGVSCGGGGGAAAAGVIVVAGGNFNVLGFE